MRDTKLYSSCASIVLQNEKGKCFKVMVVVVELRQMWKWRFRTEDGNHHNYKQEFQETDCRTHQKGPF